MVVSHPHAQAANCYCLLQAHDVCNARPSQRSELEQKKKTHGTMYVHTERGMDEAQLIGLQLSPAVTTNVRKTISRSRTASRGASRKDAVNNNEPTVCAYIAEETHIGG